MKSQLYVHQPNKRSPVQVRLRAELEGEFRAVTWVGNKPCIYRVGPHTINLKEFRELIRDAEVQGGYDLTDDQRSVAASQARKEMSKSHCPVVEVKAFRS